jgi:mono/diheme cytochrome c family protein
VLGTWLFVALWVLLGLGVFFIAIRGGLQGARAPLLSQTHGARRATGIGFTIIYLTFGIAIPVGLLVGNHANANKTAVGVHLTSGEKQGRELFAQHCGVCHTLAAANTNGKVGPNLDIIKPTQLLVAHTVMYGCLQNPPPSDHAQTCLGQGTMPAAILTGVDAQNVAKFVSTVAGHG